VTTDLAAEKPLLELRNIEASYGPFRSLFGVSFAIQERGVTALLGSNGSGKTTVVRICSGLLHPTGGQLLYDGNDVSQMRAYKLARLGVVHAPEGRSVFGTLTVEENLALTFRQVFGRRGCREAIDRSYELFPRLGERRRQIAGTLSGGEQRMLSLARVLVRGPKLLITDELSLGLAPVIIDEVYATLATIRASGTALLIVEQHIRQALTLADHVVVMAKGRVSLSGRTDELGDIAERRRVVAAPRIRGGRGQGAARSSHGPLTDGYITEQGPLWVTVESESAVRSQNVCFPAFQTPPSTTAEPGFGKMPGVTLPEMTKSALTDAVVLLVQVTELTLMLVVAAAAALAPKPFSNSAARAGSLIPAM
jgi:branched-chain amino acid transport system ATP-binding protein